MLAGTRENSNLALILLLVVFPRNRGLTGSLSDSIAGLRHGRNLLVATLPLYTVQALAVALYLKLNTVLHKQLLLRVVDFRLVARKYTL